MTTATEYTVESIGAKDNGRNMAREKEVVGSLVAVCWDAEWDEYREPVVVRIYAGRSANASRIYATVWIYDPADPDENYAGVSTSGHGYAGGGGYCKASAAVGAAMASAGVKYAGDIDGRGMGAVEGLVRAIVAHIGYPHCHIVRQGIA